MKRVFSLPDDGAGNCVGATVASILEIPIEEVPYFFRDRGVSGWPPLRRWLHARGLLLWSVNPRFAPISSYMALSGKIREDDDDTHMIVAYGGHPYFDPNVSQQGLAVIRRAHLFVPFDLSQWPKVGKRDDGLILGACIHCRNSVGTPHDLECLAVTKRVEIHVQTDLPGGTSVGRWHLDVVHAWNVWGDADRIKLYTNTKNAAYGGHTPACAGLLLQDRENVQWDVGDPWSELARAHDTRECVCDRLSFEFGRIVDATPRRKLTPWTKPMPVDKVLQLRWRQITTRAKRWWRSAKLPNGRIIMPELTEDLLEPDHNWSRGWYRTPLGIYYGCGSSHHIGPIIAPGSVAFFTGRVGDVYCSECAPADAGKPRATPKRMRKS